MKSLFFCVASCFLVTGGAVSADEACSAEVEVADNIATGSHAMLQVRASETKVITDKAIQTESTSESQGESEKGGGMDKSESAPHLSLMAKRQKSTSNSTSCKRVTGDGEVAPLTEEGFLKVVSLHCPGEMELFFNRLLDDRGYYVCSKRHIQGLMHWFIDDGLKGIPGTPNMDWAYADELIRNGNPCKYWALKEQPCPEPVGGSPECAGKWCDQEQQEPEVPPADIAPPSPECPACPICPAPPPPPASIGDGTGSISDFIFLDANGDGDQAGDSGLPGVTVSLMQNGKVIATTVTGVDGLYKFEGLPAGEYIVKLSDLPTGLVQTYGMDAVGVGQCGEVPVTLGPGESREDVDVGFASLGSIGDFVFLDANGDGKQAGDSGLAGVTVSLMQNGTVIATTVTGADGLYRFDKLPAGEYIVKLSNVPDGLNQTGGLDNPQAGTVTVNLGPGQYRGDVDVGFVPTGSIGDFIFLDANGDGKHAGDSGLPGVNVSLVQNGKVIATTVTGPDGSYKFDKLPGGEYIVKLTNLPPGLLETVGLDNPQDGTVTINLDAGEARVDVDVGFALPGSIGDFIFLDANGDGKQAGDSGLPGVTVTLLQNGKVIATTVTGTDGLYKFDSLPVGEYTVKLTNLPTGLVQTVGLDNPQDGTVTVGLDAGQNRVDVDVGFEKLGSIGDFIFVDENGDGNPAGDSGLEGVTVTLIQNGKVIATTVTRANGRYEFDNLPAGEYTVELTNLPTGVVPTVGLDNPQDGTVTVKLEANQHRVDVDVGFELPGSIGDFIFLDANGDGNPRGDSGLPGVTVSLMQNGKVIATTVTGTDGLYKFDNLPAGEYTVKLTNLPTGVVPTVGLDNPQDGTVTVNLDANQHRVDVDVGFQRVPTTPAPTTQPATTPPTLPPKPQNSATPPVPTILRPTTTPVPTCLGTAKDMLIMLDASKSVSKKGWEYMTGFTESLIGAVNKDGNPSGHQVNLQYFNAETFPIGEAGGMNSVGKFRGTNLDALVSTMKALDLKAINYLATDHPRVYTTAHEIFTSSSAGAKAGNEKVLILITDGKTFDGEGCFDLDLATVEAKIGKCTGNPDHACYLGGCVLGRCMCGQYNAKRFKDKGHKNLVVGIINEIKLMKKGEEQGRAEAIELERQLRSMATEGHSYIAMDFADLEKFVLPVLESACTK